MTQFAHNLRVLRTRKLLRTALLDLVEERGFDALTVGEIAERAMVSRAGFYRYYQDKYDLVAYATRRGGPCVKVFSGRQ